MVTKTGSLFDTALNQTAPPALDYDPRMKALTAAIAEALGENAELIQNVGIFYRIDELEERMLDILATDLHADWYDYDGDIEEKRRLIRNDILIHRRMGTVGELKTVIASLHGEATIEEWFQYGGEPYFFRVNFDLAEGESTASEKILEAIKTYKPVRARLESLSSSKELEQTILVGAALMRGFAIGIAMEEPDLTEYDYTLTDDDDDTLTDDDGEMLTE